MSTLRENKAVVRRFVEEVVNEGNYELVEELFTPDYVRHETQYDPGDVVEMLQTFEAFPDREVTIGELLAEDDFVVMTAIARGTHEQEFLGIEPTGREFEMTGMVLHRLDDGKIAESWANWDLLGMLHQLGLDPETTRDESVLGQFRNWLVRENPPRRIPHA